MLSSLEDESQQNTLSTLLMEEELEPLTAALIQGEIGHLKRRALEELMSDLRGRIDSGQASLTDFQQYSRLSMELKGTPVSQAIVGRQ